MADKPKFTGKYAKIKSDIYKGTLGSKFEPKDYSNWGRGYGYGQIADGKFYKTERGYYAAMKKIYDQKVAFLDKIEKVSIPIELEVYVDWKKGSMGAMQAKAEVKYNFIKNGSREWEMVEGERTGGWGYDKESSQVANVFNRLPSTMKILCDARVGTKPIGYGANLNKGKPYLPTWSGGTGMECFISILKSVGYDLRQYHSNGTDTYIFTLKRKPRA